MEKLGMKYTATKCPGCGRSMMKCTDELIQERARKNINMMHGWGLKQEQCFECERSEKTVPTRAREGGDET